MPIAPDDCMFVCALMDYKQLGAVPVVFWERSALVMGVTGTGDTSNLDVQAWMSQGMRLVLGDFHTGQEVAPIDGWTITLSHSDFAVTAANGEVAVSGSIPNSPPGWLEALRERRWCILYTGVGLMNTFGEINELTLANAALAGNLLVGAAVLDP